MFRPDLLLDNFAPQGNRRRQGVNWRLTFSPLSRFPWTFCRIMRVELRAAGILPNSTFRMSMMAKAWMGARVGSYCGPCQRQLSTLAMTVRADEPHKMPEHVQTEGKAGRCHGKTSARSSRSRFPPDNVMDNPSENWRTVPVELA